jgi:regulator of replication initiation timing
MQDGPKCGECRLPVALYQLMCTACVDKLVGDLRRELDTLRPENAALRLEVKILNDRIAAMTKKGKR